MIYEHILLPLFIDIICLLYFKLYDEKSDN